MFNGIYKMDAYDFTCTGVFTTTTPTDAYRGAGRPEATFAIERIMDELAVELAMDPMELRRRNWITHEEFPYTTVTGETYDSGNYEAATDRALELFDYDALRAEQAAARPRRTTRSGSASASPRTPRCAASRRPAGWPSMKYAAGGWEHCTIRVLPTGKVELVTGTVAARPGPRHGVEPDRQRRTRYPARRHRGDLRRHRPSRRTASTPTAPGRWPSAASPS